MLMTHQNFTESHSPSPEQVAQALVSRYRDARTYDMSDLDDGTSGIDDSMHIFNQPTNEDAPLWVCKVKGSLFSIYLADVNSDEANGPLIYRLGVKWTWSFRFSSNLAPKELMNRACYPHLLCLHAPASFTSRRLLFHMRSHHFFVRLIGFHSIQGSWRMKSLVLFPSMSDFTRWFLLLLFILSQSHHTFLWTNHVLCIMATFVSLAVMKTLNGLKSLSFLA